MLNHLFQLSGLLLLLNLLVIPYKLFGQSQYANINLENFIVGGDSYMEYGAELSSNALVLFDSIPVGRTYSLEIINGIDTSCNVAISLDLGGTIYTMEIDSLNIYDDNGVQISQIGVVDTDEVYFVLIGNNLQYKHNDLILLDTTVTPVVVPEFSLESFNSSDVDVYMSIYDFSMSSGNGGDLVGMAQRTTSPYCLIPVGLGPVEANYLCNPKEPPVGLSAETYIFFPSTDTITREINLGFPDVIVNIKNLDDQTSTTTVSGDYGYFNADINEGMLQLIPYTNQETLPYDESGDTTAYGYDCYLNPPISVEDEREIRDHLDDIDIINCPLKRIAADIDQNGRIDTLDANLIREFVLGNIDSLSDQRWRFVPKAYVIPNAVHPDLGFIGDFWNTTKSDSRAQEYPFNASFSFNGKTYRYLGPNSWMGQLHEWPYATNEACEDTNWGFYVIEIGDVVQTRVGFAGGSSLVAPITTSLSLRPSTPYIHYQNLNKKDEGNQKNNQKLTLQIRVTSTLPIVSYQMGLRLDSLLSGIDKIKPREGKFKQSLKENYGQRKKTLDAGIIRTAWIRDPKTEPNGLVLSNDLLFSIELKAKKTDDLGQEELLKLIRLDELMLPSIFYGEEVIDDKIKISVEILDKEEVIQSYGLRN